jgi:hypothetical protein
MQVANSNKAEIEQNANKISSWLVEHRAEFEQDGISEDSLISAAGISAEQAAEAIDRLENKEVAVRDPEALSRPPRFKLKPGRSWPETREKLLVTQSASPSS